MLSQYNKNMDNSINDLVHMASQNMPPAKMQKTYEWNKAKHDIRDWTKFREENEALIANLKKKKEYNQKKQEIAAAEKKRKEEEMNKQEPPVFTKRNVFIVSLGILGFACLFFALAFWRWADSNTEGLAAA